MSQPAYWASGVGPHRCQHHETLIWVPGEGAPAQPQRQELKVVQAQSKAKPGPVRYIRTKGKHIFTMESRGIVLLLAH